MKILHLGFEDHARPGAGGGSWRNHQVNSRLAARHEVTVVVAAFDGARSRVEDGVTYRHVGVRRGYNAGLLAYDAALPWVVTRSDADLVVEEFAPVLSSLGVGRWTRRPVLGMVQWYFSEEKAREYHLPAGLVRRLDHWGTRGHDGLIALSTDLATQLRAVAPGLPVHLNGMGIEASALEEQPVLTEGVGRTVAFLARMEIDQKGIDLLLEAWPGVLREVPDARLVLAGDGKDADKVVALVRQAGLSGSVELPGRVGGAEKWRLLREADVLAMPSRYETFGLTALEAMACATSVVGFTIPCLRETVPPEAGTLVEAFDTGALTDSLVATLRSRELRRAQGAAGRALAARHTWEQIADRQEQIYLEAV